MKAKNNVSSSKLVICSILEIAIRDALIINNLIKTNEKLSLYFLDNSHHKVEMKIKNNNDCKINIKMYIFKSLYLKILLRNYSKNFFTLFVIKSTITPTALGILSAITSKDLSTAFTTLSIILIPFKAVTNSITGTM